MILWLDAQLSPRLARWISEHYPPTQAFPLRDLGLRDAEDEDVFAAARHANVTVVTKDSDFVRLLEKHGPPPKLLWLTCGNTSNATLGQIFARPLLTALGLLEGGEDLVETGAP